MSGGFAGALNQRVAVEQWQASPDPLGGDAGQWIAEGWSWAAIVPAGSSPSEDGAALGTRQRYKLTMRDRHGFGPLCRLIWNGKVLSIRHVTRNPAAPDRMLILAEARI